MRFFIYARKSMEDEHPPSLHSRRLTGPSGARASREVTRPAAPPPSDMIVTPAACPPRYAKHFGRVGRSLTRGSAIQGNWGQVFNQLMIDSLLLANFLAKRLSSRALSRMRLQATLTAGYFTPNRPAISRSDLCPTSRHRYIATSRSTCDFRLVNSASSPTPLTSAILPLPSQSPCTALRRGARFCGCAGSPTQCRPYSGSA